MFFVDPANKLVGSSRRFCYKFYISSAIRVLQCFEIINSPIVNTLVHLYALFIEFHILTKNKSSAYSLL